MIERARPVPAQGPGALLRRWGPPALAAAALAWHAAMVAALRPAGAIGNDPATYAQMALDLAAGGGPSHTFPLLESLRASGLSWEAFVTPGYRIAPSGAAAPLFAWGLPALMAVACRAFGDTGLYLTVPALGGLSIVLTYLVGQRLLAGLPGARLAAAVAALLVAAAPKQITHALVPMSDVPAQCFALLAMWLALRAEGRGDALAAAGCGLALGLGYLTRHTVALMAIPVILLAAGWGRSRRERAALIGLATLAGGLAMAPDLAYRAGTLGGPLAPDSPESAIAALANIAPNLGGMAASLLSARGFGPLILAAPLGIWQVWRRRPRAGAVLLAWAGAFALFHAPLMLTGVFENDLRYLLPAYPALTIAMAGAAQSLVASRLATGLRLLTLFATCLALAFAARGLLRAPAFASQAYGWLGAQARADLEALADALPPGAVIGAADQQAGAVALYAGRDVFRPGSFVDPAVEFPRFLQAMRGQGRAVYAIGDPDCGAPDARGDQLPAWLLAYTMGPTGVELRGLPVSCRQWVLALE